MDIHINAISEEQFAELVSLVRANHAETTATLAALGAAMANNAAVLREVAAGLRGPLATSILDLISERDASERARVDAVNALAEEQGREATETAEESQAAKDLRDAFGEVAGLFDDPKLPDVEPLPEPPADVDPTVEEPGENTDPEPAAPSDETPVEPTPEPEVPSEPEAPADEPVPAPEEPAVDPEPVPGDVDEQPAAPADEPAEEPVPADEVPADEQPSAPADEPIDDGSGAIEPADEVPASDVPDSEAGATPTDVAPNPGAEAEGR